MDQPKQDLGHLTRLRGQIRTIKLPFRISERDRGTGAATAEAEALASALGGNARRSHI